MKDEVKVAAAQIVPEFMDKEATIDKACRTIEEAGRKEVDLIVFPETFIPGYPYWRGVSIPKWANFMVDYQKNSVKIPSEDTEVLAEAAREANTYLVMGCSEISDLAGSLTMYNTLLYIDREGGIMGRHRKLMPTHGERTIWGMGDASDLRVFDTGIGRVGGLVCYENHMTLLKAAMALKGEEIHCAVWPGYWQVEDYPGLRRRVDSEEDPTHLCEVESAIREYAFETQTFVISVGQYMPEDMLPEEWGFNLAGGGSAIVAPSSIYVAGPVFGQETILYSTLDNNVRRKVKAYFDALGHYARWDVARLDLRDEPWTPLTPRERSLLPPTEASREDLEGLARRYGLDLERLMELIEELKTMIRPVRP
ncbi:MAG: carbon-nitrogen hydrolase family protein [Candidatus Geothermarchaeales archaeon]